MDTKLLKEVFSFHPDVETCEFVAHPHINPSMNTISISLKKKKGSSEVVDANAFLNLFLPKNQLQAAIQWNDLREEPAMGFPATQNEKAQQVLRIIQKVLKNEQALLQDNFLELGGTSIQAIHLASVLQKEAAITVRADRLLTMHSLAEILITDSDSKADRIDVVEASDSYPLSHAQKRFWMVEQLEHDVHTSVLSEVRKIYGAVDVECFGRAIAEIVKRHESLRTIFFLDKEEPRQRVVPIGENRPDYAYVDLNGMEDQEGEIADIIKEQTRSFDLERDPMIRVRLIATSPQVFTLVTVTHHIVFDGWSFDVL
ncbi:MAG: condensation domain-containing protein, partial [Flammeovirgaceae bacterium]